MQKIKPDRKEIIDIIFLIDEVSINTCSIDKSNKFKIIYFSRWMPPPL